MPKKSKKSTKRKTSKGSTKNKKSNKNSKNVNQHVHVNVHSTGGSGGGGSSMPAAQTPYQQPLYQAQYVPPQFNDKSGENVKLVNLLAEVNKKLSPAQVSQPNRFDFSDLINISPIRYSSPSEIPAINQFPDDISEITDSFSGEMVDDSYQAPEVPNESSRVIRFKQPRRISADVEDSSTESVTMKANPILFPPRNDDNDSLLSRVSGQFINSDGSDAVFPQSPKLRKRNGLLPPIKKDIDPEEQVEYNRDVFMANESKQSKKRSSVASNASSVDQDIKTSTVYVADQKQFKQICQEIYGKPYSKLKLDEKKYLLQELADRGLL